MPRKKVQCLVDDKTYAVTGPNGYRAGSLTRDQADRHHDKLVNEMRTAGWAGTVRTYYRDGSCVQQTKVGAGN